MAAGKFNACLPYTLREEGGYSNDAGDPGGKTDRGVTQKTYDLYRAKKHLYARDVRDMADAELLDIYRIGYWDAISAETLPPGVDLSGFDYAVNSGARTALPAIAKAQGGGAAPATVIDRIANERLSFLHGLKTWRAFGTGWGPRVARIEAASLRMARQPITAAADAAKAKVKANSVKAKGGAIVAASALPVQQIAGSHAWIGALVLGAFAFAAGVAAFNAWRQNQRAVTLTAAASSLAAETVAANALAGAAVIVAKQARTSPPTTAPEPPTPPSAA